MVFRNHFVPHREQSVTVVIFKSIFSSVLDLYLTEDTVGFSLLRPVASMYVGLNVKCPISTKFEIGRLIFSKWLWYKTSLKSARERSDRHQADGSFFSQLSCGLTLRIDKNPTQDVQWIIRTVCWTHHCCRMFMIYVLH